MREKSLHRAAVIGSLLYGPTAAGAALEAHSDPPSHRKQTTRAEDGAHDPEGERGDFPTESAQPAQEAAGGATGTPGGFVRNIHESIPPPTDQVAPQPGAVRRITESIR